MKALREALRKAKKEFGKVVKDAKNSHFGQKYPTLDAVLDAVVEPLEANGLDILPATRFDVSGRSLLVTEIAHTSGESIKAEFPLPQTDDPQKLGSAITYGRRYTLCALLNLVADDDDDGNKAAGKAQFPGKATSLSKQPPKPQEQPVADGVAVDDPEMGNTGFQDLKDTYNTLFKESERAQARQIIRVEHGLSEVPDEVRYPDQYILMALIGKLGARKDKDTKVITGLTRSRLEAATEAIVQASDALRIAQATGDEDMNDE